MTAENKVETASVEILVNSEVTEVLAQYEKLGRKFKEPPRIKLSLQSQTPREKQPVGVRDIAVSTAIQCYAPGVAGMNRRDKAHELGIAESTLHAGHHTTRMHAHFTWQLIGVSRAVTHDLFHNHPFYNSEQQSQRYVEAKSGSVMFPTDQTPEQQTIYGEAADFSNAAYFDLLEAAQPAIEERLRQVSPSSAWNEQTPSGVENPNRKRLVTKRTKIAQEIARYALPIGQKTMYFHTLSHLELARLWRVSAQPSVSDEGRYIIGQMVKVAAEADPTLLSELEHPIPSVEKISTNDEEIAAHAREFDASLEGNMSVGVHIPKETQEVLADAVRTTMRRTKESLSDEDALKLLMSPRENHLVADVYDAGIHDPLTQALRQVSITFKTRLSHAADSQRQRHRRTPGATPPGELLYAGEPDYITPMIIAQNPELKAKYDKTMQQIYRNVDRALEAGIPQEQALLLLPNAHAVRVQETGDLFDWMHRWKQRLCFLAQEEIFFVTVDQVKTLLEVLPEARGALQAPCGLRKDAGQKPFCPEGDRFCGQPVWKWEIERYAEERVV